MRRTQLPLAALLTAGSLTLAACGGSDMTHLEGMSGAEFDTMFLQMMIKHHQGAITMAKTEISAGKNADATSLARSIETAQTAEIDQMRTLLKK